MTEKKLLEIIEDAARKKKKILNLSWRGIKSLPAKIGELSNLRELELSHNQLTSLPAEIGQLTNLTKLILTQNQLSSLPAEIEKLANLTNLLLDGNHLSSLPAEIGKLSNLEILYLDGNHLSSLPAEIGKLSNLEILYLGGNKLSSLQAEIGHLTHLTELALGHNQLTSLLEEIGKLTNLTELYLHNNQLTNLPAEIGRMTNLMKLFLGGNQLTSLPAGMARLERLAILDLDGNPLKSPPAGVVEQGTQAILAYLREQLKEGKRRWVSKLLFVGEGGVGKTSLLRTIKGEEFIEGLNTTHGIGVDKLKLAHPKEKNITMELNTWDFGGQQIYHATHQFFLTNRALFVLVWDARHGWEAGKLYQWLDRIQAKAPESPVIIAAAHIDERDADLPLEDLRKKYPQIVGHYKISNKTRMGIEELRAKLADVSARLPLMGEEWPAAWLDAANEIRGRKEHYISPKELYESMGRHNVTAQSADVLARWLHELGDILYFREDEELNDLVILNPQWVTEAISRVLESEEVIGKDGIFTQQHMDEVWSDIRQNIREHLLRLMERFDLSYRTLENREISLVVERLPLDPPDYEQRWTEIKNKKDCKEISMKFELSSVPAGIPTWFIARSHRFTTHTHWRMGALFTDSEKQHLALIEAYPHDRYLRLTMRGPAPHNFFALLRDGLELTLERFPGLKIKRTMPCPGHDGNKCSHEFDYGQLEKAVEKDKPALEIQCPESFQCVSIPSMLFGIHWSTDGIVNDRIDTLENRVVAGQDEILTELQGLKELTQREFLRLFNAQQGLAESHCPKVFAILPKDEKGWLKNILGQKMVLQLFCQAPGRWHPAVKGVKGGRYEIKQPAEFFKEMGPYILKLAKVIKYAAPVAGAAAGLYAGPIGAVMGTEFAKKLTSQIKLMEELATKLSERDYLGAELLERAGGGAKAERIEGAELRTLRKLLDEVDKKQEWGGLKKVLTPEGHYLWLCEEHAAEYKK
jgi:small GTP-binding protein